ncbi:MAG: hypothetical protein P8104_02870 [Gammaproteobacteria bacterium]
MPIVPQLNKSRRIAQHVTLNDDRPDWDANGLALTVETESSRGNTLITRIEGLVLPNKVKLRDKTTHHLFPLELGGYSIPANQLKGWCGANYAIPIRALASRIMGMTPTFTSNGWCLRHAPRLGVVACFEAIHTDDNIVDFLRVSTRVIDISTGKTTDAVAKAQSAYQLPNRLSP